MAIEASIPATHVACHMCELSSTWQSPIGEGTTAVNTTSKNSYKRVCVMVDEKAELAKKIREAEVGSLLAVNFLNQPHTNGSSNFSSGHAQVISGARQVRVG